MINVGHLLAVLDLQDQLSPAVNNAINTLKTLDSSTTMTSSQVRTLGEYLGLTSSEFQQLGVTSRLTTAQLNELTGAAGRTAYQLTLLGRGMSEIGMLATATFTVPIVAATKAVVDFGGEFEAQMTKVVTLAGASRAQVDEMTGSVLKLSEASGVGPSELAKGLYVLMSTGQSTTEAMKSLAVAADMSAMGMGNMHDTTLAITGAMFAYRESNLSASDAANVLIKAVQLGNMEIQDLVPAIARVNPIAAALGVSFQDVAAGIATFTHAGVDSSVAATGMRAMLNNILTDSVKTEKGFAALSRALNDNSISMANFRQEMKDKGFTTAMVDLAEKVTAAGDAGVKAFGSIFPNVRALTEALFVYKTNGGMVVDMLKDMNNGTDELAIGAAELHKTWKWQWEQMKVSIENLWISLSTSLLPIFKGLLELFKSTVPIVQAVVDAFNALPLPIQAVVISTAAFLALLGPGILVIGQFAMALGNIARGMVALNVVSSPAAFIALLSNPYLLGAAAVIIALGAAFIVLSEDMRVSTETTYQAIAVHKAEITELEKLQKELTPTIEKSRGMLEISEDLVRIAPEYIGSIGREAVSYADLKKAVDSATESKKKMLATDLMVLAQEIEITKAERAKAEAAFKETADLANRVPGATGSGANVNVYRSVEQNVTAYREQKKALDDLDAKLADMQKTYNLTREVLDKNFHAQEEQRRATEAAAKAAELAARGTMAQAAASATLAEEVSRYTEQQKAAIAAGIAQGYNTKQIVEELGRLDLATGITAENLDVYKRQMSLAATASKALAKDMKEVAEADEAMNRVMQQFENAGVQLGEAFSGTDEEWGKLLLSIGASVQDIHKSFGISIGDLQMWKKEVAEAARFQKEYEKDTLKSINQIEALTQNTTAFQIKADGDTYEAKKANVETWYIIAKNALNNMILDEAQFVAHSVALWQNAEARKAAIEADRLEHRRKFLESLKREDENYIQESLALQEKYFSIVLTSSLNAGAGQLESIQAHYIKAEAENQKHLDRMLQMIIENDALSWKEKEDAAIKEYRLAKERTRILENIAKAQKYDAMVDGISSALSKIDKRLGESARAAMEAWKIISNKDQQMNWETGQMEAVVKTQTKWVAGLQAAAIITNDLVTGTDRLSTAVRSGANYAAMGAAIGVYWGGVGAAVGAVAGAIYGLVVGWNSAGAAARDANRAADKELEKLRYGLLKTYGTLNDIDKIGKILGVDLAGAWGDTTVAGLEHFSKLVDEFEGKLKSLQDHLNEAGLTWKDLSMELKEFFQIKFSNDLIDQFNLMISAGVSVEKTIKGMSKALNQYIIDSIEAGVKIPPAMEPILQKMIELGYITDEAARKLLGLADSGIPSLDEIKDAAKRYGLELDALGPKVAQLSINELAAQIVKDWKTLIAAGADAGVILSSMDPAIDGMGKQVQNLVNQAIKYGLELPESLKPILEAMIKAGTLTDENGEKMKDLSKLTFAKDLTKMFDELIKKLGELIDTLASDDGALGALKRIGDYKVPPVKIPYYFEAQNEPPAPIPNATGGNYYVQKPTLFLAGEAGPEQATFTPLGSRPNPNTSGGGGGGGTVNIQIQAWDGASVDAWLRRGGDKKIAAAVVPKIPGVVRSYGLT